MRSFANCFLGLLEDLYRIKSCFWSPEVVKMIHCYDQILKNGHFFQFLLLHLTENVQKAGSDRCLHFLY